MRSYRKWTEPAWGVESEFTEIVSKKEMQEKMRRCVYAGSFDPPTNGHAWMIDQSAKLFDELVIAVGVNPSKKPSFSLEERISLLCALKQDRPNLRIDSFEDEYLVHYAKRIGVKYMLRGIRSQEDFGFENMMRHVNSDLCDDVSTVYLIPPRELAEVSSSLVRGLIGPKGWKDVVKKYVPEPVYEAIINRYR